MMTTQAHDENDKPTKVCFSYIRFSSPKQRKGNSEERQLEIAPRVARREGWFLDESLSIADPALSAWKKANLGRKGKLGAVMHALKAGKIPSGTIMIIEAFDRLTRARLDDAYELFRDMLKAGLEIYVDKGERHYTLESLRNPTALMLAIAELNSANAFAEMLSERGRKGWREQRERLAEGEKLTKKVPGWIDATSWEVRVERADVVRRIFQLYDSGRGISSILRILNSERVPTWGKKDAVWNSSYISQLLHSRAVLGEFQAHVTQFVDTDRGGYYKRIKSGEAVENYFPQIVLPSLFYRVQARLGDNKKAARTECIRNLFAGLAHCKSCGNRMYLAATKKAQYYMCSGKLKGLGCFAPSMRYEPLEVAIVRFFQSCPEQLLREEIPNLSEGDVIRGQIAEVEKQIKNITEFVMGGTATRALGEKQAQLERDIEVLRQRLQTTHARQVLRETGVAQLAHIKANIGSLGANLEMRQRVRDWLIAYVHCIKCDTQKGDGEIVIAIGDLPDDKRYWFDLMRAERTVETEFSKSTQAHA